MADVPSWVLDTNVVVSGLLSPYGPPGRLLDMVVARQLRMTLDDRIESEYRQVLGRPGFSIEVARREAFLAILSFQDRVSCMPRTAKAPPDIEDAMFLEAAAASSAGTLVTGNLRHFPAACRAAVTVITPRQAWNLFVKQFGR